MKETQVFDAMQTNIGSTAKAVKLSFLIHSLNRVLHIDKKKSII